MKFDLEKLLKEAEEDSQYWQSHSDTLLTQAEIDMRMQQSKTEKEQSNDD